MKRPVAKISNHLRRLATFANDVSDHSLRLVKVTNVRFALLRVQSKRTFRPYFCLIADIQGINYVTITFPPLIILQNKIYYQTINYIITVIPDMTRQRSLRAFARVVLQSPRVCGVVSVNLMENALRIHGDCITTPQRLRCELKNFWTGWKCFARWQLQYKCAETRCEYAETERRLLKTEKCSIRSGVAKKKCDKKHQK